MTDPIFVDTHVHLFFSDYATDRDEVLERARAVGVRAFIIPGTDVVTSRYALELAERYSDVYAAVGFHPHDSQKVTKELLNEIATLTTHPKVVAVGEIGLDFYYTYSPWDIQKKVLWNQLELAALRDLPVIIHSRDSMPDVLELLRLFIEQNTTWRSTPLRPRGVFHCFPGSIADATKVFEMNFLISFTGSITFRNSRSQEVLREVGIKHILLETDSPFMAPVPYRGKRNEPSYILPIAQKITTVCNEPLITVARVTTDNAVKLFGVLV
ncbi:MAG: TatD family hydrolase [Bacteroidetes bacterium]|nr:TatD family hydrolase [Bacteroidota bacterium]